MWKELGLFIRRPRQAPLLAFPISSSVGCLCPPLQTHYTPDASRAGYASSWAFGCPALRNWSQRIYLRFKILFISHQLLDRKEWVGQLAAVDCVRGGKGWLVGAGAWIELQIQSRVDVLAWSCRPSNSVHFGFLVMVFSVKCQGR